MDVTILFTKVSSEFLRISSYLAILSEEWGESVIFAPSEKFVSSKVNPYIKRRTV